MRVVWGLPLLLVLAACGEESAPSEEGEAGGVEVAVALGGVDRPLDAMPSPDGSVIYFVTDGAEGSSLVRVEGDAREVLASFEHARSLVVSRDGATVYVGESGGGVYAVDVASKGSSLVAGTEGYKVGALDLAGGLVVAGEATDGEPGVWLVPTGGGEPAQVVSGLSEAPTGVAALEEGDFAVALPSGSVVRAEGGGREELIAGVTLGDPAGLALTPDGGALMISSLSSEGSAQVILLDLETKTYSVFDDVIGAQRSAGGLHKAWDADVYAWADLTTGIAGTVFRVTFR